MEAGGREAKVEVGGYEVEAVGEEDGAEVGTWRQRNKSLTDK